MACLSDLKRSLSSALFDLLIVVVTNAKKGETEVLESLGLKIDIIQRLEKLNSEDLKHVSRLCINKSEIEDLIKITPSTVDILMDALAAASRSAKDHELANQFILHGATKQMMSDYFGMRSTVYTSRCKMLNVSLTRGRKGYITDQEERAIYNEYKKSAGIVDERERLLKIATETNAPLHKIEKLVGEVIPLPSKTEMKRDCRSLQFA